MKEDQDSAAKALYECNTNGSAPRWEQLGDVTKTVWREELDKKAAARGVVAHSKSEYKRRTDMGDPNVLPPALGVSPTDHQPKT